jgi:hypothetical protein
MRPESIQDEVKRHWSEDRKVLVDECAESIDRLALAEILLLRQLATAGLAVQVMRELRRKTNPRKSFTR